MSNTNYIYLSPPDVGDVEKKLLNDAYDSNWIAPVGPDLDKFEKALSQRCNRKDTALLASGTCAIHIALNLLGVGSGDVVLCQSFTFAGTINPVIYCKAIPQFIDSESITWNMDPELLQTAILDNLSKGILPKAIIAVHLYGMPAQIDDIVRIGHKFSIPVIEDAAEALGSIYDGKPCGSYGDFSILSFNGNKIITCSGGGALLSNDVSRIAKARFLSTQARDPAPHYEHSEIGYNYRMSNLLAALGRGQLVGLDQKVENRRNNYLRYKEFFKNYQGINLLCEPGEKFYSNRWLTTIIVNPEMTGGITREDIRTALWKHDIESRPLWKPMHMQPVFRNEKTYKNGVSENLFHKGLCLPSGSNLTEKDFDRILNTLVQILK